MSQHHLDDISQFTEHEAWEHNSDCAPTPGYFGSPNAALSTLSPSPSSVVESGIEPTNKSGPHHLKFLQLYEWEDEKDDLVSTYKKLPELDVILKPLQCAIVILQRDLKTFTIATAGWQNQTTAIRFTLSVTHSASQC